ncbi:MAG: hypothetical protein IT385_01915 [Deltaproteobacteria bacterium]|nr:hypothetical protein [Deltaproteobacteria bacterium]
MTTRPGDLGAAGSTPRGASSDIPEALEQGVYAWVFGDGDEDPGLLVTEGQGVPELLPWLARLEQEITLLKHTLGKDVAASEALARLRALAAEVERAQPIVFPVAIDDVAQRVVPLDEARRRRNRRLALGGSIVLAIAAALLLVTRGDAPVSRPISAEVAEILTRDIASDEGFGFGGGVEPNAHDRGFLLGAIIDLSRQREDGRQPGATELALARKLAVRALRGLDAPDDPEAQRMRSLGGCAAILGDDPERSDCERGMMSYVTARDSVVR